MRGAQSAERRAQSAVHRAQSAEHRARCAVRGARCAERGARSAECGARSAVRGAQSAVRGVRSAACSSFLSSAFACVPVLVLVAQWPHRHDTARAPFTVPRRLARSSMQREGGDRPKTPGVSFIPAAAAFVRALCSSAVTDEDTAHMSDSRTTSASRLTNETQLNQSSDSRLTIKQLIP